MSNNIEDTDTQVHTDMANNDEDTGTPTQKELENNEDTEASTQITLTTMTEAVIESFKDFDINEVILEYDRVSNEEDVRSTALEALQVICAKHNLMPSYRLTSYEFEVTVGTCTAYGSGETELAAKKAAATKMIMQLHEEATSGKETETSEPSLLDRSGMTRVKTQLGDNPVNPVGNVQEFCVSRHLPLPVYHLTSDEGPCHMKIFKISCTVGSSVVVGSGSTKKAAKFHAALLMYKYLGI